MDTVRDLGVKIDRHRIKALQARVQGDAATYAQFRDRYRDLAKTVGFEAHIALAEAMP